MSKMVRTEEIIGAKIVDLETWGPITVEKDGRIYEIRMEEGHSGTEHNVYEMSDRAM